MVSGRTTVSTCRIDGNHRYSWIPAIVIRQPNPTMNFTPQNDQLMSERRILCLKPTLRLEGRGQDGQDEAEQGDHCPLTLGDSVS
jgi:hypothetical protein